MASFFEHLLRVCVASAALTCTVAAVPLQVRVSPALDTVPAQDEPKERRQTATARMARHFPFLAKVPRVRPNDGDYVVLVHGLTWARATLRDLGKFLHQHGYHVIEVHYPSHSIPISAILDDYLRPALRAHCSDPAKRVHFVAHSMGCVMVRKLLTDTPIDQLGRVVLLAAPNKGAEMAGLFSRAPLFGRMLGASVRQISAEPGSVPNQLGPVAFGPGIIMGTRSRVPFAAALLPGPDDGVVRVDSGSVAGMAGLITVAASHGSLHRSRTARAQILHFLGIGQFSAMAPALAPDVDTLETEPFAFGAVEAPDPAR